MSTTFKSAFRKDHYNSPGRERINIDDELSEGEFAAIRREKLLANGYGNGNGKHESPRPNRLALIPEAIRLADAEVDIGVDVGLWSRVYKRHLIRLSELSKQLSNGNGAHVVETNGERVSSGPARNAAWHTACIWSG
jgi:hypothetical protein